MDDDKKHSLGHRAFFIFLFQRIRWVVITAIIVAGLWYLARFFSGYWLVWINYGLEIITLLWIAFFLMVLLRAYLEYRYYTYTFTDEAFVITYGVVVRNEIGALYHQIQNVSIQRGVSDRLIGISRLLIFLDGDESGHAKIMLPAVERKKARLVQKELLVRAKRSVTA